VRTLTAHVAIDRVLKLEARASALSALRLHAR